MFIPHYTMSCMEDSTSTPVQCVCVVCMLAIERNRVLSAAQYGYIYIYIYLYKDTDTHVYSIICSEKRNLGILFFSAGDRNLTIARAVGYSGTARRVVGRVIFNCSCGIIGIMHFCYARTVYRA